VHVTRKYISVQAEVLDLLLYSFLGQGIRIEVCRATRKEAQNESKQECCTDEDENKLKYCLNNLI
jgi:hypothetical protein